MRVVQRVLACKYDQSVISRLNGHASECEDETLRRDLRIAAVRIAALSKRVYGSGEDEILWVPDHEGED